jgi:hypothetical protein
MVLSKPAPMFLSMTAPYGPRSTFMPEEVVTLRHGSTLPPMQSTRLLAFGAVPPLPAAAGSPPTPASPLPAAAGVPAAALEPPLPLAPATAPAAPARPAAPADPPAAPDAVVPPVATLPALEPAAVPTGLIPVPVGGAPVPAVAVGNAESSELQATISTIATCATHASDDCILELLKRCGCGISSSGVRDVAQRVITYEASVRPADTTSTDRRNCQIVCDLRRVSRLDHARTYANDRSS